AVGVAASAAVAVVLAQSAAPGAATAASKEWPTFGHDSGGMRFSPLTEITPDNVSRLEVASVEHMKHASRAAVAPPASDAQAQPAAAQPSRFAGAAANRFAI